MPVRDQLRRKTRRRVPFDLVIDDPTDAQAAVEAAAGELRLARLRHDDPEHPDRAAAQAMYDRAKEQLREHVLTLVFEGIPEHEWDELRSAPEHAPTADQAAQHQVEVARAKAAGRDAPPEPDFNPTTLMPALFARCHVPDPGDPPLTEAEWADVLAPGGTWQTAERAGAFQACVTAILQPRSVSVPKD